MTRLQIERQTEMALESCRECINNGILTGFGECMFYLAGYTKNEAVRMDVIVNTVQEWVREGLIKDAWGY